MSFPASAWKLLEVAVLVGLAPILVGLGARTRAFRLAAGLRQPLLQPWHDIYKLMRKRAVAVVSAHDVAAAVALGAIVTALSFLPILTSTGAAIPATTPFAFVALWALARVSLGFPALISGPLTARVGFSREGLHALLGEPVMFLASLELALLSPTIAPTTSVAGLVIGIPTGPSLPSVLAAASVLLLGLVEQERWSEGLATTAPTSGGPTLACRRLVLALRQLGLWLLVLDLALPWGLATSLQPDALLLALALLVLKLGAMSILGAALASGCLSLRLRRPAPLLLYALVLAWTALLLHPGGAAVSP